jgi:hypothetical protein
MSPRLRLVQLRIALRLMYARIAFDDALLTAGLKLTENFVGWLSRTTLICDSLVASDLPTGSTRAAAATGGRGGRQSCECAGTPERGAP